MVEEEGAKQVGKYWDEAGEGEEGEAAEHVTRA